MKALYRTSLIVLSLLWPVSSFAADFSALKKIDSAEVIEVITPQTIMLRNGQIIHLAGIRFPDYTPQVAGSFAVTAIKILKDMLGGQSVEVYQTKNKDWGRSNRMGHDLAHLYIPEKGLWVQGALLSLGLAQVETAQRNPEMAAQMLEIEKAAREEKTGIWEEAKILSPEETPGHLNSFQIVEGKIESAAIKKNRYYLNFGGNWRDDFTVSIAPENKSVFSKQGINPLDWNGKRVRVRGWVQSYNGPYIDVTHPEAIEILQ